MSELSTFCDGLCDIIIMRVDKGRTDGRNNLIMGLFPAPATESSLHAKHVLWCR
jgi:hypothetical protein